MTCYPFLQPEETERLAKLTEECGEISQMVGKTLVHGWESTHPRKPEEGTNRERLEKEVGGLMCVVELMMSRGDLSRDRVYDAQDKKRREIGKYLHHQYGLEVGDEEANEAATGN